MAKAVRALFPEFAFKMERARNKSLRDLQSDLKNGKPTGNRASITSRSHACG
jgi:hypothetical protein